MFLVNALTTVLMWWCLELALKKRLAAVIQVVQKGNLLSVAF